MRGPGRIVAACIVLTLAGATAASATVAEKVPAAGGLTAAPEVKGTAPVAAPGTKGTAPVAVPGGKDSAPAVPSAEPVLVPEPVLDSAAPPPERPSRKDDTSWGVLVRGGYFGLPDVVANKLFRQHPKVAGETFGAEFRYHGDGGGRGVASIGFAFDYAKTEGDGIWQTDKHSQPKAMGGGIKMYAATLTGYWSMFPSWYVHPYVGIGVGAGYFEGKLKNDNDLTEVSVVLPVLHLPVGLAFELGEHLQLSLEARFLDGIAAGAALQARF